MNGKRNEILERGSSSYSGPQLQESTVAFTGKKVMLMLPGEQKKEMGYRLDPGKSPKWIDFTENDNIYKGIYKFKAGKLTIAVYMNGVANRPSAFVVDDLLMFLKRVPAPVKKLVLTPEEAILMASASKMAKEFNAARPAVEFKVKFVTKSILVKAGTKKNAGWQHGHSPKDICLRPQPPKKKDQPRFVAILTEKAIKQMNRVGITDIQKHFKAKAVRVTGRVSWAHYDGYGTPSEVEIVVDDLRHLEVVK